MKKNSFIFVLYFPTPLSYQIYLGGYVGIENNCFQCLSLHYMLLTHETPGYHGFYSSRKNMFKSTKCSCELFLTFIYSFIYFYLQYSYISCYSGPRGQLLFCFKYPFWIKRPGLKYLKINSQTFTFINVTTYIFIGLLLSCLMIKHLVNHSQWNGYRRALEMFP